MFLGLLKNELIKLFAKKKTFIIWGLFILLCVMLVVVNETAEKNYLKYNSPKAQVENLTREIANQEDNLKSIQSDTSISKDDKKINIEQTKAYLESLKQQLVSAKASLDSSTDWKSNLKNQIEEQKKVVDSTSDTDSKKDQERELKRLQLHLDNNVPLNDQNYNTGINFYILNITMIAASFLAIGLTLFNGDNVSNEYNPGTLKFLLVQPVSRIKVLLSKYVIMLLSSTVLIMVTQFLFFLGVGIIKGFGSFNRPYLVGLKYEYVYTNGQKFISEVSGSGHYILLWQYLLEALVLQLLFLIVMVTFILMISTISKSSVVTMTVLICAILGSNIVYSLSTTYRKASPFIFLHYANIDDILTGQIVMRTGSFLFTWQTVAGVSALSTIIFLGVSLWVFKKRDIQI
ncbi:ABC-2 type transport system permease protein [Anaerocolumna jejuensis DSM 15929]|uniref:ABC-2 type transport system permease protein n=1 Tax=Anaerocolumna jejuensis DSM 15929 TaxID=1121322 RepID=A0A1M6M9I2_9FIRM|nr:ABC transporter permease subunit [Anaerocolumna jejuensis]SHJ80115.1 ABC-2 type transport system permease protein [Anaerocolumna jejuensis DSM 15929]